MVKFYKQGISYISDFDKINTKEQLTKLLAQYKGILNNSMIEYLESLINLEFSVIRDNISYEDRYSLSELEVYKRIAMYNIYKRALILFKENGDEIKIFGNKEGMEGLCVYASNDTDTKLFEFNYKQGTTSFYNDLPSDCKIMQIGNINLYQIIESQEFREAELEKIKKKLIKLNNEKNPFHLSVMPDSGRLRSGGDYPFWANEHRKKIEACKRRYELLKAKKELTDKDRKAMEITQKYYKLFLEDYGLTDNDFKDEFSLESTKILKKRVKEMNHLDINSYTNYI